MNKIKSRIILHNGESRKMSRNRLLRISVYVGIFVLTGLLVATNIKPSQTTIQQNSSSQNASANFVASSKLPVVTSGDAQTANIASTIANNSSLNASDSASNRSITMSSIVANSQADVSSANKSASVSATSGVIPISSYTVQDGDTAAKIASKFGISDQTVRQANNLSTDDVSVGATLNIPAVDGVIYTTVAGDSLESIASKYSSNTDNIIAVNNLTDPNVPAGTRLLLPDGTVPVVPTVNNSVATNTTLATRATGTGIGTVIGSASQYSAQAGNRYYYGECTWYAYNRRVQLGLPVGSFWGNANTWAIRASSAGFVVNHTPSVGAIFQTTAGSYGHVGVVESVNPDGTITISEMNYSGWAQINRRTISNPGSYNYIH